MVEQLVDDLLFVVGALALPGLLGYFQTNLIAPFALALVVTVYNVSVGWRWNNMAIGWGSCAVVGLFLASAVIFPIYLVGYLVSLFV